MRAAGNHASISMGLACVAEPFIMDAMPRAPTALRLLPVSAALLCGAASRSADAQTLVEWPVADGGNGSWYELVTLGGAYSISVAEYEAQLRSGKVAELEQPGEFAFVRSALAAALNGRLAFVAAERTPLREPQLLDASHPVFGWIRDARTTRLVDLVLVGDSNIAYGGLGWDHGLQYALHAGGVPCAAIGPTPFNDDGGTVGWRWSKSIGPAQDWPATLGNHATSTQFAPPQLAQQMDFPLGFPNTGTGYAWLSSGSATIAGGMYIAQDHPFVLESAPLEIRIEHGLMPKGGRFTPSAWRLQGGNGLAGTEVHCASKKHAMSEAMLAVPAGFAAGSAIRLSIDAGSGVQAPFFLGWTTVERTDITHGSCVSVLNWNGGASSERIADDIESFDGPTSARWVEAIRARQLRHGGSVRAIFVLCSGMNDFGLTLDEHESSLRRMIDHLSSRWTAGGGAPSEIGFLLMTSHDPSIDDPTENFVGFRARCRQIASERTDTATIDLGAIPMARAFYEGSQDSGPHLSQVGYESIASRVVEALDGSQGAGCEWRWRSGALVGQAVDAGWLPECGRARAAISGTSTALLGIARGSQLGDVLIEYRADCDDDGLVDRGAVAMGVVQDLNGNFIPDGCECLGDIDQNGNVDSSDMAVLLGRWGSLGGAPDLDLSGSVDAADLVILLANWGPCQR